MMELEVVGRNELNDLSLFVSSVIFIGETISYMVCLLNFLTASKCHILRS